METSGLSPSAINEFEKAITNNLLPLARDFQLAFEQIDSRLFMLTATSVSVKVYFPECHGYDVDIRIARVSSREWYSSKEVSFYWVTRFLGLGELPSWRATSEEQISELAKRKIDVLRQAMPLLLSANQSFWEDLSRFVEAQISGEKERDHQWLEEKNLSEIRQQIDLAWRAKDYAQVISLFEEIKEKMSAAEMKKLEYARKHLE